MLGALILRGVPSSFATRHGPRWIWDFGFCGGSLIAAFVQGVAVGALAKGLPMGDGHYAGGILAGSAPLPASAASGCVLATPFLGQDGWS